MHYASFLDQLDEPNWDLTRQDQYTAWYYSIDQPYRTRIFKALKAARDNLVLSGHIHRRRPVQVVEGIQVYKAAAIAMPQ